MVGGLVVVASVVGTPGLGVARPSIYVIDKWLKKGKVWCVG